MESEITWKDGVPFSLQYNDIYFPREDAICESWHVFIVPNNLSER